eukprot:987615-Prymnesium_polylepis.1
MNAMSNRRPGPRRVKAIIVGPALLCPHPLSRLPCTVGARGRARHRPADSLQIPVPHSRRTDRSHALLRRFAAGGGRLERIDPAAPLRGLALLGLRNVRLDDPRARHRRPAAPQPAGEGAELGGVAGGVHLEYVAIERDRVAKLAQHEALHAHVAPPVRELLLVRKSHDRAQAAAGRVRDGRQLEARRERYGGARVERERRWRLQGIGAPAGERGEP